MVFLRLREMRTARQEGFSVKTGSLVGGGRKVHWALIREWPVRQEIILRKNKTENDPDSLALLVLSHIN